MWTGLVGNRCPWNIRRQLVGFIRTVEDGWKSDEIASNPTQLGKARLIFRVCVYCLPPVLIILGVGWVLVPERPASTLIILVGHLLVTVSGVVLRWSKSVTFPATFFLIFGACQLLGATYLTGSIVSPVVYAFPVFVSFACILGNSRLAFMIGGLLWFGCWYLWLPDVPAYEAFTDHAPLPIRLITLAWSMAAGVGLAWLFTEESRRSEAELRSAIEDRDRFVAYVSHELRNPLTAILGAADLLALGKGESSRLELIDALHRSAQGMTRVLDDLLDISKGDAGMLALNLSPTMVQPVLDGIVTELAPLAETLGVHLVLEADATCRHQVMTANSRLKQVLRKPPAQQPEIHRSRWSRDAAGEACETRRPVL